MMGRIQPRAGVELKSLTFGHQQFEAYESFMFGRTLITLDVQIGRVYLYYMPVVNNERKWDVRPPQTLCDATSAWLNSYHGAISYEDFITKMFGDENGFGK